MPVEMIGWIAPRVSSEMIPSEGLPFNPATIARTACIHERADFDRALIGYFSDAPDGFLVGAHAASVTERLKFLLAHRPGVRGPPGGCTQTGYVGSVNSGPARGTHRAGGSDVDQAKDGDWSDSAQRYRRSAEYVDILKKTWTKVEPFDHVGEFYHTRGTHSEVRCFQSPHVPIYGGGGSDAAVVTLSPVLDVFMLWAEPLAQTSAFMERVRTAAGAADHIGFSLSSRPILGDTEAKAWDRARQILERVVAARGGVRASHPQNVGSQRLLAAAEAGEVHDTCLWTKLAEATGARGNSTALVGTPDTVAAAMVEYYKLGASSLLVRGYDPLPDSEQYGAELIPKVRELVREVDAASMVGS